MDVLPLKGGGAAGGLGAGCMAFLNATLVPGIDLLFRYSHMDEQVQKADIVVTGEGKIDNQTLKGKVVAGLARLAATYQKPVIAFCGVLDLPQQQIEQLGLTQVYPLLTTARTAEQTIANAGEWLTEAAFKAATSLHTTTK